MTAFETWWRASKYCQVVIPEEHWKQIARDGWEAALRGNKMVTGDPSLKSYTHMVDIHGAEHVQISINQVTKVVHVNVDGVCMFRSHASPVLLELNGKEIKI